MALKIVGQLKDSITRLLSGVDISNVNNINGAIESAARITVQKAGGILEASGIETVTLYSGVTDYRSPSTIFASAITDIRAQGQDRLPSDYVYKEPGEYFDRTKGFVTNGYKVSFEYRKGVQIMRVAQNKTVQKIELDPMNDDDGWTAGGSASSLAVDETVYFKQPASLRFNLAAAGSQGYLEKTLDNALDLTAYEGVGVVFLAVYLPSATAITSIGARIGNNSSNYFSVTETEGFLGAWRANDFLLIALDLAQATETGSVDITAIDYVRVFFNYDGTALANVRVGGLFVSLPSPHNIYFRSAAIFMASDEDPKTTITNDNDEILLNDAAYSIFEHEAAKVVLLDGGGTISSPVYITLDTILHMPKDGLYPLYRAANPSDELNVVGNWYDD